MNEWERRTLIDVPTALRMSREAARLTQRAAAVRAHCSHSAISQWEKGHGHHVSRKDVAALDATYGEGGALLAVVDALRGEAAVPADEEWAAHPPVGPVWGWFRSPEQTVARVTWGPWRADIAVPGPDGVVVTAPTAMPNPPLIVRFDSPGRVDVAAGYPPRWIACPVVDGLSVVRIAPDAPATLPALARVLMQLFPGQAATTVDRLTEGRGLGVQLAQYAKRRTHYEATRVPGCAAARPVRCNAALARRARGAWGLGLRSAASEASRIPGVATITPWQVRRLEERRFPSVEGAAALDMLYRLDGRMLCAEVNRARDHLVVRFPSFWVGPVWVLVETAGVPGHELVIAWGGHRKHLCLGRDAAVTFRKSFPEDVALRLSARGYWISAGLGRYPGATDVNAEWRFDPRSQARVIRQALERLRQAVSERFAR